MADSDLSPAQRTRKAFRLVLNKLPHGEGKEYASKMGISDTELSNIKNKMMEPALLLLAHLGFKVVSADARCLRPADFEFLTGLHARMVRKAPMLIWEDSETGSATQPGAFE